MNMLIYLLIYFTISSLLYLLEKNRHVLVGEGGKKNSKQDASQSIQVDASQSIQAVECTNETGDRVYCRYPNGVVSAAAKFGCDAKSILNAIDSGKIQCSDNKKKG